MGPKSAREASEDEPSSKQDLTGNQAVSQSYNLNSLGGWHRGLVSLEFKASLREGSKTRGVRLEL